MDKTPLALLGIVVVVGLVGALTAIDLPPISSGTPAARVISEAAPLDPCASCSGESVCAGMAGKASNYPSACDAHCAGARIIYDDYCERIPRVAKR